MTSEIRRRKKEETRKMKKEETTAVKYKPFGIAMPCELKSGNIYLNKCAQSDVVNMTDGLRLQC